METTPTDAEARCLSVAMKTLAYALAGRESSAVTASRKNGARPSRAPMPARPQRRDHEPRRDQQSQRRKDPHALTQEPAQLREREPRREVEDRLGIAQRARSRAVPSSTIDSAQSPYSALPSSRASTTAWSMPIPAVTKLEPTTSPMRSARDAASLPSSGGAASRAIGAQSSADAIAPCYALAGCAASSSSATTFRRASASAPSGSSASRAFCPSTAGPSPCSRRLRPRGSGSNPSLRDADLPHVDVRRTLLTSGEVESGRRRELGSDRTLAAPTTPWFQREVLAHARIA